MDHLQPSCFCIQSQGWSGKKERVGTGDNPLRRKKGYVKESGWVELSENLPQIFSFQVFFFIDIYSFKMVFFIAV